MIKRKTATSLFGRANVNLVYEKDGKVVVGVEKKLPPDVLSKKDTVPKTAAGMPTDVIEVGPIEAFQKRTDKWRPAPGGVSIGHYEITAGTLGMVVLKDERRMILSNNHVLSNSNDAQIGDDILQPGPLDIGGGGNGCIFSRGLAGFFNAVYGLIGKAHPTGRPTTRFSTYDSALSDPEYLIGHLAKFVPIKFDGTYNRVDCALALPTGDGMVRDDILDIGVPERLGQIGVGEAVRKSGRTTGYTEGTVQATEAYVKVGYGGGRIAVFENQIITNNMLDGGDSGSISLRKDALTVVGLCFAGSSDVSVMNNISDVHKALGGFVCVG